MQQIPLQVDGSKSRNLMRSSLSIKPTKKRLEWRGDMQSDLTSNTIWHHQTMSGWKKNDSSDHSKRQFGNLTTRDSAWMTKGVNHLGPIKGKKTLDWRIDNRVEGKQCDLRIPSLYCRGDVAANDTIQLQLFTGGTEGCAALSWREAVTAGPERAPPDWTASANVAPRLPSLPPYSTRWLGNINYYLHAALAGVQLECGGLLNVSALCFHFGLNHQITVCLRSQVRRFLLCQAGALPRLSPRFVNLCLVASGDKHLRTSTARWRLLSRPWNAAAPPPQRVIYAVKSNIISNPRDEKLRWVQTPIIFLRSLSVYLTPVDFGSHEETQPGPGTGMHRRSGTQGVKTYVSMEVGAGVQCSRGLTFARSTSEFAWSFSFRCSILTLLNLNTRPFRTQQMNSSRRCSD